MAYGYSGDITGDANSEAGIGDRDNALSSSPDHQSAALTVEGRMQRFGLSEAEAQKSSGLAFDDHGKTYYDDDTAPTNFTFAGETHYNSPSLVDVFDPTHPPDVASTDGLTAKKAPAEPTLPSIADPAPSLAESPEPAEQKPVTPQETPLTSLLKATPEYRHLSTDQVIQRMGKMFPDVPADKLQLWAQIPGGAKLIQQYQDRDLSPLEKFRKHFPFRATGDDAKDIQFIYDHYGHNPDESLQHFSARVNPPSGILGAVANIVNDLAKTTILNPAGVPATPQSLLPTKPFPAAYGQARYYGGLAGMESSLAWIDELPKATTDALANLYKTAGVYGWVQSASDWLSKNVPGYGAANDFYRKFVTEAFARGREFEKQSAQAAAQIPKDPGSQVVGTIAEAVGQLPRAVATYGAGEGGAAMLFASLVSGTSAYGHAIEYQQKNALLQGVSSAGFAAFNSYIFNTGAGRVASGVLSAAANASEDQIDKFLRGEPNEIAKEGKVFTVGLLVGLLFGGKEPEAPLERKLPLLEVKPGEPVSAASILGPEVSETQKWFAQPPIQTRPHIGPFTPSGLLRGVERLPSKGTPAQMAAAAKALGSEVVFSPAALEEFQRAVVASQNGEHDIAAQYIDRGLVFSPDEQKRALAQGYIDKVDELAAQPKTQKEDGPFNDYFFSGLPSIKSIPGLSKTKKAIEDWFESDRPGILPKVFGAGSPEYKSREAQTIGAILKKEEARSRAALSVIPGQIARRAERATGFQIPKNNIEKFFEKWTNFHFGTPIERAERFFNNFTTGQLHDQFIKYEEARVDQIQDPTARWLWKNLFGPTNDAIAKRDHFYGIAYDDRDNYVYHLLTHPKDDMPKLREAMVRAGINPSFVKPQEMRIAERLALGHEMITVNPIRLMLARWWASERAIQKIRDLRELATNGLAWDTAQEGKNVPQEYRTTVDPANQVRTADGRSYYVHPDAIEMLNNKFNPVADIFRDAGGGFFKFIRALKGGVALKLSWSLFHPFHVMDIMQADAAADALGRMQAGVGNWNDALNVALNLVPFAGSIPRGTRAYLRYGDEVNYLQGKLDFNDLTTQQQRNVQDWLDMGLVADLNEERQLQFSRWIQDNGPAWIRADKVGPLIKMGLDVLGNPANFNRWWFNTVTPRLKFASAMARRDSLELSNPQLFRDTNKATRLRAFQNINRDVEGRFGEMHYDNLFWPKWYKQTGTTFLLSLGWQTGLFRTMGDGVVDLTRNLAHMDEIKRGWQTKDPQARKLITNRMAFTASYLARGLATGWAISYLVGGKNPFQGTPQQVMMDGIYPVVGKDQDGREKRVNMQYFIKDAPALMQYSEMEGSLALGVSRMALNKMNPMAMSVWQAVTNKDYMDHTISTREGFDSFVDRLSYLGWGGFAPISFEQMQVPGQTPGDKLMAFLGYSPSGRWTMRSDTENRIIARSIALRGQSDLHNAREKYRQAYLEHDSGLMQEARQQLLKLGQTDKNIKAIQKNAHITTAQYMFRDMSSAEQAAQWHRFSPEEQKAFWPYVHRDMKRNHKIWLGQQ